MSPFFCFLLLENKGRRDISIKGGRKMRRFLKIVTVVLGIVSLVMLFQILQAEANNTYNEQTSWIFVGVFGLFSALTVS